jgi:hypothetical protein
MKHKCYGNTKFLNDQVTRYFEILSFAAKSN